MKDNNIIHLWDGFTIRQRPDGYINLSDMSQATGESIDSFFEHERTKSVIIAFYKKQDFQIKHPIDSTDVSSIWICRPLASEFSFQCENAEFSVWLDGILWDKYLTHPEVVQGFFEQLLNRQKVDYDKNNGISVKAKTYVYFVLNKTQNEVKIGFSRNPECRLRSFQTGTTDELVLLKQVIGGRKEEQKIHLKFANFRIKGEIFQYSLKLKSFIEQQ